MKDFDKDFTIDKLVFALDFPDFASASAYLKEVPNKMGVVKVGLELFLSEGPSIISKLRKITRADIFLDLKLHDIPVTIERSVKSLRGLGLKYLTIHTAGGREMLLRAREAAGEEIKLLGVSVLTSSDINDLRETGLIEKEEFSLLNLVEKRALLAKEAGLAGLISSAYEVSSIKKLCGRDFLAVTPGIRPLWSVGERDDQKRIMTPLMALKEGADLLVIGRPLRDAPNPKEAFYKLFNEISGL